MSEKKGKTEMELAIATDYLGESVDLRQIEQRLENISEAGITHVHWAHEWDGDYIYSFHEMEWIKGRLDNYKLGVKGIHASKGSLRPGDFFQNFYRSDYMRKDYSSINEYSRKAGVDLIKNRVDMAELLETKEVVLHMILPCCDFTQEYEQLYYRQIFRSLDELEEYCRPKGIRICIENMWAPANAMQIAQMDKIFSHYEKEFLGICVDTGHALLADEESRMLELVKRYKNRIYCIHAQDNPGPFQEMRKKAKTMEELCRASGQGDCHWIPFEGKFDWEGFAEVLAQSPYAFPIVLETVCREQNEIEFLKKNFEAGKKLTQMVKQYRNS